jgi:hypothetical protein
MAFNPNGGAHDHRRQRAQYWGAAGALIFRRTLERFPTERTCSVDKKSRQIKTLERNLLEKSVNVLPNAL